MTRPDAPPLDVTREQVLAYRRRVQALDERLPAGPESLRRAASAGLQDSVPRSALHSLNARVEGVGPDSWEDPALVQVWGPRYTAFVVPAGDQVAFTLGRMPEKGRTRERAIDLAGRLRAHLDGRRLPVDEAARGIGAHHNALRYASLTGTVLIRWGGARQPMIWTAPHEVEPMRARLELLRRYLHAYGPTALDSFIRWGGLDRPSAAAAFEELQPSLLPVRTPRGDGYLLAVDEPMLREPPGLPATARLLPSGDPYFLLWGADRDLLVPDQQRVPLLWTSRVWPGALLLGGEVAGTWRRDKAVVTVEPWRRVSGPEREAVEAEAASLPLPDITTAVTVRWEG